jgi:hypothetical protein
MRLLCEHRKGLGSEAHSAGRVVSLVISKAAMLASLYWLNAAGSGKRCSCLCTHTLLAAAVKGSETVCLDPPCALHR